MASAPALSALTTIPFVFFVVGGSIGSAISIPTFRFVWRKQWFSHLNCYVSLCLAEALVQPSQLLRFVCLAEALVQPSQLLRFALFCRSIGSAISIATFRFVWRKHWSSHLYCYVSLCLDCCVLIKCARSAHEESSAREYSSL